MLKVPLQLLQEEPLGFVLTELRDAEQNLFFLLHEAFNLLLAGIHHLSTFVQTLLLGLEIGFLLVEQIEFSIEQEGSE